MILWRANEAFDLTLERLCGGRRRRVVVLKEVGRVIAANQNCWEDGRTGTTIKLFGWRYKPRWGYRCYPLAVAKYRDLSLLGQGKGVPLFCCSSQEK